MGTGWPLGYWGRDRGSPNSCSLGSRSHSRPGGVWFCAGPGHGLAGHAMGDWAQAWGLAGATWGWPGVHGADLLCGRVVGLARARHSLSPCAVRWPERTSLPVFLSLVNTQAFELWTSGLLTVSVTRHGRAAEAGMGPSCLAGAGTRHPWPWHGVGRGLTGCPGDKCFWGSEGLPGAGLHVPWTPRPEGLERSRWHRPASSWWPPSGLGQGKVN